MSQVRNSLILIGNSLGIRMVRFGRQFLMAYYVGVSASVDQYLVAQMVPTIILAAVTPSELVITMAKRGGTVNDRLVSVLTGVVMLVALALAAAFALTLPVWARVYGIDSEAYGEFRMLSLVFIANIFPALLVSVGTSVAFMKDRYAFYTVATIGSELLGLVCIVALVSRLHILAFGVGTLTVSVVNGALLASLVAVRGTGADTSWRDIKADVVTLLRRMRSISGQVCVSYAGQFVDRALSVRFLEGGYLSRVNYAQAVFELPNTMIAGSIGTTTYVEQARSRTESREAFEAYTRRMFSFMVYFLGAIQVAFMAAAPILIIVLYRRGRFDNSAVEPTLLILELLTLGLVAAGLTTFFERTLYVDDQFHAVLATFVGRVFLKLSLLGLLIQSVPNIIPLSTTLSFLAGACLTYGLIRRTPALQLIDRRHVVFLVLVGAANLGLVYLNHHLLPFYLTQTGPTIVAAVLVAATLVAGGALVLAKQTGIVSELSLMLKARS